MGAPTVGETYANLGTALDQFIKRGADDERVETRWLVQEAERFKATVDRVRNTINMSLPLDSLMTLEEQDATAIFRLKEIADAKVGYAEITARLDAEAESIRRAQDAAAPALDGAD